MSIENARSDDRSVAIHDQLIEEAKRIEGWIESLVNALARVEALKVEVTDNVDDQFTNPDDSVFVARGFDDMKQAIKDSANSL